MKGIIFSGDSVRAILEGRKTQTRRVFEQLSKHPDQWEVVCPGNKGDFIGWSKDRPGLAEFTKEAYPNGEGMKPRYSVGEVVYVKEPYYLFGNTISYRHTHPGPEWHKWSSPLFMPASAARLFIQITAVLVERLQDISESDAISEGARVHPLAPTHIEAYREKWDDINRKTHPWESNPWVWVYEFKRVDKPA
jgi:hypothetical protein